MSAISLLQQRRSVRHFDATVAITQAELAELLNIAVRAPSGNNAQPWRFVVITEPSLRARLLPVAFQQQQIMTASALILLLADRQAYQSDNLTRIHQMEFEDGCFDAGLRDFLTQAAIGFYQPFDERDVVKAQGLDVGLVAMSFMLVAAERGWHTVPMTGYQPELLRRELNIPDRYVDIMMLAIGKGTQPGHRTLRYPIDELLFWNRLPN